MLSKANESKRLPSVWHLLNRADAIAILRRAQDWGPGYWEDGKGEDATLAERAGAELVELRRARRARATDLRALRAGIRRDFNGKAPGFRLKILRAVTRHLRDPDNRLPRLDPDWLYREAIRLDTYSRSPLPGLWNNPGRYDDPETGYSHCGLADYHAEARHEAGNYAARLAAVALLLEGKL